MKVFVLLAGVLFGQAPVDPVKDVRLVVVSTSWCGPCQRLKAFSLPEVKKSVPVEIVDGDTDTTYGVSSYPTIICFVGKEEKWRMSGYSPASTIIAHVKSTDSAVSAVQSHAAKSTRPKSDYGELFSRVKNGDRLTLAVGVPDDADYYVKSLKGFDSGVYECLLAYGVPKMRKLK